jgi:pyruvate,water dikinase
LDIRTFDQISAEDAAAVGGKAINLALLAGIGLPVPPGYCVTTAVHRRLGRRPPQADPPLCEQIADAYRRLGGGLVAVRSSATAEDGASASFAGQQETVLGVTGEDAILGAIARCWASLDSERTAAYRRRQGLDDAEMAMAVVVQRLVPAEISGVLFTRDPLDAEGRRMLVEASWGLGESVVSGKVVPDRYTLDRETGTVLERHIHAKTTMITAHGPEPVPPEKQDAACLDDARLAELADLGRRVEAFYREARDVEWAWADGRFWLLQARPITALSAAESAQVRREEIAALAASAEPGGTVWSRYNLAEVLPEPTPMTWQIVRRFMSGGGGFGLMYRDLGFDPDPALDEAGIYDLVCGRPYCNLSREPRVQFRWLPFAHSFAALKAAPHKAIYPQATLDPARGGWRFWLLLPILFGKLVRSEVRLARMSATFASRLRAEILPAFAVETARAAEQDLSQLDPPALLERLDDWIKRTLIDFARDSLKPTVFAALAMAKLKTGLLRALGPDRIVAALGELTMGARPDPEADLPAALQELAERRLDEREFVKRFGHRGPNEMELSEPRWAEMGQVLVQGSGFRVQGSGRANADIDLGATWARIAEEAKLPAAKKAALEPEVRALHTYLGLRETAKHYLMMGYALIRRILVELDRRFGLHDGIFFLTPEDLPRLAAGESLSALIQERRKRRALALSLEVPSVLFSDDLEAIGRPEPITAADTFQGIPLSVGVAEGPALVLHDPATASPSAEPYVLVCPSTDPAWVPLFLHARALVMETGGVLSHGAIVAREFGLPAVAGLPAIHRRLRTGQRLRVNGGTGTVTLTDGLGPHREEA